MRCPSIERQRDFYERGDRRRGSEESLGLHVFYNGDINMGHRKRFPAVTHQNMTTKYWTQQQHTKTRGGEQNNNDNTICKYNEEFSW
eukprot:scaffold2814_cov62-Alexandrium_tamarense.AAC.1